MNFLDIVIVNYKSTDHLINCLTSIHKVLNGRKADIFVEDNASEDHVDKVKDIFPHVTIAKNRVNLGFAKAVNKGSKKGHAPYLVILNPDTVVLDGFFDTAIHYMDSNPDIGILGPKIFNGDGTIQGSARRFPTALTGIFGRNSLLTRYFPNNPFTRANILTSRSDGRNPMQVDWVSGACMVVRRKSIENVGLFDERFFMYWEDADWCKRMWEGGWKVIYFPAASIIHHVGASSERLVFRSIIEFHKSSYRLLQKYKSRWITFLKPFVIGGLALRIVSALAMNRANKWYQRHKGQEVSKGKHRAFQRNGKTKVLRLISRLNIGGPAIHVSLLTRFLNNDKFESFLAYGSIPSNEGDMTYLLNDSNIRRERIPEIRREISPLIDTIAMARIFRLIMLKRPDIVHTHTSKAGTIGRLAVLFYNVLASRKISTVHTFHGNIFDGYFGRRKSVIYVWVEHILANITDVIIAISESQKNELVEKFHIAPVEKVRKIELGFELKPFLNCGTLKGQVRQKLGIDETVFLVGIIGRLVPIKNHIMFLRAAQVFLKKYPEIPIRFMVLGDGELKRNLESYCHKHGLSQHVLFCGWTRNVASVYADLNVLSLTSLNEGTPVSIIEAMASSVPVIATAAGGVLDLIGSSNVGHFENGFEVCERGILCKKKDVSGFVDGMRYLLNEDDKKRDARIERARNYAIEHFSKERLLKEMEELYLGLAKGEKDAAGSTQSAFS